MAEEIYLLDECKDITFDEDKKEEWLKIIDELDLTGQKELVSDKESPIPFLYMNESMKNVYETLCPCEIGVNQYSKSPIPLQVLGIIKLCETENYFEKLIIRYDDVNIDPVLVGINKTGNYSKDYYLLARWGNELDNLEQLREKARQRWIGNSTTKLQGDIAEKQSILDNIENHSKNFVAGNNVPYF